ncbi:Uu.00g122670.m01.CDS01 [Anthostomella pinea]|uniref:Transcription initiation factor IIE subunit beta n=1 Tax=Anthostomella pinea TaxID=933095 RepID=A0AAI8YF09_9PEZI|nr:Uu.00g122670.m01.CDS01 [Anthostomella pinea]
MSTVSFTKLNGNGKRLVPPSSSAASPPANTSPTKSDGTPTKKQKRDNIASMARAASPIMTPAAAAAAAKVNERGGHIMTQLAFTVEFLKTKREPKQLHEILDHLTLSNIDEQTQKIFVNLMRNHPRINYVSASRAQTAADPTLAWRTGTYEFKAKIPGVHSKEALLGYLQGKTDASSLAVKDLKDGWPDCDAAITELEDANKILVVRTKKDNHAKLIWANDPYLCHSVDPMFKVMWHNIEIPTADDIVRKLAALGQKPASEDPRLKKMDAPKTAAKKRKSTRPPKHQSNSHMAHLLKDFSHLKR